MSILGLSHQRHVHGSEACLPKSVWMDAAPCTSPCRQSRYVRRSFLLSRLCERSEAIQPNVSLTLMPNTSPGKWQGRLPIGLEK
jgi:hypothetical protein